MENYELVKDIVTLLHRVEVLEQKLETIVGVLEGAGQQKDEEKTANR
jgi:hypothetical protein